ncbi:UNVERIFIED_CONTAM: hypothetical protein FKN15_002320 [Acipenser sinensis]
MHSSHPLVSGDSPHSSGTRGSVGILRSPESPMKTGCLAQPGFELAIERLSLHAVPVLLPGEPFGDPSLIFL